jgi:hypothetical protein
MIVPVAIGILAFMLEGAPCHPSAKLSRLMEALVRLAQGNTVGRIQRSCLRLMLFLASLAKKASTVGLSQMRFR